MKDTTKLEELYEKIGKLRDKRTNLNYKINRLEREIYLEEQHLNIR